MLKKYYGPKDYISENGSQHGGLGLKVHRSCLLANHATIQRYDL